MSNSNYRTAMNPMTTPHPSIQTAQTGGAQPQPQAGYPPGQVRNPRNQQPRFAQQIPAYQQVQPIYVTPGPGGMTVGYTYPTAGVPPQHAISVAPGTISTAGYPAFQPYHYTYPIRPTNQPQYAQPYHTDGRQQPQPFQRGVPIQQYQVPHHHQQHGPASMTPQPQPQPQQQQPNQPQQQQLSLHQPTGQSQMQSPPSLVTHGMQHQYSRVVEAQGSGGHRSDQPGQIPQPSVIPPATSGSRENTGTGRKKKILPITDPKTGKNVIADGESSESATEASKDEDKKTRGAEAPEVSAAGLSNAVSSSTAGNGPTTGGGSSDAGSVSGSGREGTPVSSAPTTDDSSSRKAKYEFFHMIAQTVDVPKPEEVSKSSAEVSTEASATAESPAGEGTFSTVASTETAPSSTAPAVTTVSSNNNEASATTSGAESKTTTPDTTPATTTPRSSPTVEKEKTEDVVTATEVADNKTAEETTPASADNKDVSSSVAAAVVEEETAKNNEDEEVDTINKKVEEIGLTNGQEKSDEEELENVPSHEMSTTSISPVPMEAYCDSARSQDDSVVGETTSSLIEEEKETEEQEEEPDSAVQEENEELEEGEIHENGSQEDAKESEGSEKKGIVQYNRDLLLRIGQESKASKTKIDIKVAEVIKDSTSGNTARPPMNHQQGYGRGPRGGKDFRGLPSPMMPINRGGGLGWGIMGSWEGGRLPIPPTPPPGRGGQPGKIQYETRAVKLATSENPWKPGQVGTGEELSEDERQTQAIVKQTRGILNKLTPENFGKLLEKFLKLQLNDREDRISAVIKVVFEKAIDEPNFSMWYAKMVHEVCSKSPETSKKFRKEILDQCQREFQKSNKDEDEITKAEEAYQEAAEDKKEALKAELEEKRFQMRRRSLGNVRFIGELYKLQMLTPKIMVDCVQMLLGNQDEESYECLCKLLTTVGQKLDKQLKDIEDRVKDLRSRGQPLPKFIPEENYMDKTFKRLRGLSNDVARLSSRIRFALLDLVEMRESDWKPRRDANAPKTIDEVRREALRQEQEEKQKINALPEERGSRRPSPMNAPPGQQKKSDWNTVPSNKSSRFQVKRPTEASNSPVLAPPGGLGWGQSPVGRVQNNSRQQLPPRLQQLQQNHGVLRPNASPMANNRFNPLITHDPSGGISTSSGGSGSAGGPPQLMPSHRQRTSPPPPPPSSNQPTQQPEAEEMSAEKINETVKNIFEEFLSVQKFEDTLDWIKSRFRGDKIVAFVDSLSRMVAEMSKENQQVGAGKLIKMLIKQKVVQREQVLSTLKDGVIPEIPDIEVDTPKVTTYFAMFVLEVFGDEPNLNWLVELVEPLQEDFGDVRENLIRDILNLFKSKRTEQYVKSLWNITNKKDSLLVESLPWLNDESRSSLVDKMIPVLKENEPNEIINIFKEQSWDLRESEISSALILAICEVCYQNGTWNTSKLEKLVSLLSKTPGAPVPNLWKVAKEFIEQRKVGKDDEQILWKQLLDSGVVTNKEC